MKILLRSGWQTVNIGDIAITPGMLRLIERHIPGAEVTLELFSENEAVRKMIAQAFPAVRILPRDLTVPQAGAKGNQPVPSPEYAEAMRQADLFLYSSGPIFSYGRNNWTWDLLMSLAHPCFMAMDFDLPWGCYGQSFDRFAPPSEFFYRDFLGRAAFLFCRDTDSLKMLNSIGVEGDQVGFAPDATFAFDLRDEVKGGRVLDRCGLQENQYLCATCHYRMEEELLTKFAAILETWIRRTGLPVLLTPETTHNIAQHREQLLPLIAEELREQVHLVDHFWLPDEAGYVYERATAMISAEMHSVIIALAAGTPAIMFRYQGIGDAADARAEGIDWNVKKMSDGLKNRMMSDLGLGEWLFYDSAQADPAEVAHRLIEMAQDPQVTQQRINHFRRLLEEHQRHSMEVVANPVFQTPASC